MTTTPPPLAVALQQVSSDITHIAKNQKNASQGFRFRGIDDVLNAIHEPLAKHGVSIIPIGTTILSDTERTSRNGSTQYHVRALVTYQILGPAGDSIQASVLAEAADAGDKVSSKLLSMAYKYLAFQVFSIPVEGMDDADAHTPEPVTAKVINIKDKAAQPVKARNTQDSAMPTREEVDRVIAESAGTLSIGLEQITKKFRTENGGISMEQFAELPVEDVLPFARELAAYAKQAGPRPE